MREQRPTRRSERQADTGARHSAREMRAAQPRAHTAVSVAALGALLSSIAPVVTAAVVPDPCNEPVQATAFSNTARYARDNAELGAPRTDESRIVFLGDSITEAWSLSRPAYFARAERLNRGISGQTTSQMLLRFRQDVISLRPAVVHILAGTNDVAGNTGPFDAALTESNIASMVELARANGIAVVLGSVLPAAAFEWHRGLNPGPTIAALNDWLKTYARAHGVVYVDYHSALTDSRLGMPSEYAPDGVHPSATGYKIMEPLAEAGITTALGVRQGMSICPTEKDKQ